MKKTIFISSTFIDLKNERKKVWECLENFDVIVKGMEKFGARKTDPLTTCLNEVEQSDVFVAIIAFRYGSEDILSEKSYSQLEYEKACETVNDPKKDILIYFAKENAFVNQSYIQYDKMDKLNKFKAILKNKHTIDSFSDTQDLIDKIQRKFTELFTPKIEILIEDEYEKTQKNLEQFFLVPALYSGREIKLKIKFIDNPQPVSKAICNKFNFDFGKTILNEIKILSPEIKYKNFKYLIIEENLFEKYMSLEKSIEYEIYANLLFSELKANTMTTDFKDRIESVLVYEQEKEPDYDDYREPFIDVLKFGDGQIVLVLRDIIENKNNV